MVGARTRAGPYAATGAPSPSGSSSPTATATKGDGSVGAIAPPSGTIGPRTSSVTPPGEPGCQAPGRTHNGAVAASTRLGGATYAPVGPAARAVFIAVFLVSAKRAGITGPSSAEVAGFARRGSSDGPEAVSGTATSTATASTGPTTNAGAT